jgi:hypothetical protein
VAGASVAACFLESTTPAQVVPSSGARRDDTRFPPLPPFYSCDICSLGKTDQVVVCFQLLQRSAPDQTVDLMLIEWEACLLSPTSLVSLEALSAYPVCYSRAGRPASVVGDDTKVCTPLLASPAWVVDSVLAASTTPPPADPSTLSGPRRSSPGRNSSPS